MYIKPREEHLVVTAEFTVVDIINSSWNYFL